MTKECTICSNFILYFSSFPRLAYEFLDWARKGVSPAFSITNLNHHLPEIRLKMVEFTAILNQHVDKMKPMLDFPSWMVKLTIDFISTTMFKGDFHTLGSDDSPVQTDGQVYLINIPLVIKVI